MIGPLPTFSPSKLPFGVTPYQVRTASAVSGLSGLSGYSNLFAMGPPVRCKSVPDLATAITIVPV